MKTKIERDEYRKAVWPQDHWPTVSEDFMVEVNDPRIPQDWSNWDGGAIDSHYSPVTAKD